MSGHAQTQNESEETTGAQMRKKFWVLAIIVISVVALSTLPFVLGDNENNSAGRTGHNGPPLASMQKTDWPKMVVLPGQEVHPPVYDGYKLHVDAEDGTFEAYAEFASGKKCTERDRCNNGAVRQYTVKNLSKKDIDVLYAYEKI